MDYYIAISCLLALTASVKADGAWGGLDGLVYAPKHSSADYYSYPRYAFEYAVKDPHTGDNKAQWEKREGDVVKGAYSLVEPDGSLRVVEYWADDKSGFNAVVKRVGPNLHPTTIPAAPIYKAPIPVLSHGPALAPISVGSVAKYSGLASAPLITGPVLGGAISTANLYKAPAVSVAPVAPILPAPIIKPTPILSASLLPIPYNKDTNYPGSLSAPYLSAPIIKSPPLYTAPLTGPLYSSLPGPLFKSGPILSGPIGAEGSPLWKDSIGLSGLGLGGHLGGGHWDDLRLLGKGLLPSWNQHLDYSLADLKH